MYSWVRLSHLVEWTSGVLSHPSAAPLAVTAISTDSRSIKKGNVFLALRGEKMDGHQYIDQAVASGASAVIGEVSPGVRVPFLKVPDTLKALVAIGKAVRAKFTGKVFAITGSAGKSSTKEMLSVLLGENTVKSPASFNNLMGVSRTLYLVDDKTKHLVLEMGMNASGEIAELCKYFRPQGGLITNIGDAHIGRLGGKEGIFRAKKELFDHLASLESPLGVAINADDTLVLRAFEDAFATSQPPKLTYSASGLKADVSVLEKTLDPDSGRLSISVRVREQERSASLPIFGLHHAENLAAAITGALLMGRTTNEIWDTLPLIRPAQHRGEIHDLSDGSTLIDECYNSNPSALSSSLRSFCRLSPKRRRLFVIGEMRELGSFSPSLHRAAGEELARACEEQKLDFEVIGVGDDARFLAEGITSILSSAKCSVLPDAASALVLAISKRRPKDLILVKGSHGVGLERVVAGLLPA